MTNRVIICGPRLYKYHGWFFGVCASCGPWPLKKDGYPRKRVGKVFYNMYEKFSRLTDEEKLRYRVGGGCVPFGNWS